MKESAQRINLTKLASERKELVESMARELEGPNRKESASDLRWPSRFISAGAKGAPPRWPSRFIAADTKSAPPRWGTRFVAAGPKSAPVRQ